MLAKFREAKRTEIARLAQLAERGLLPASRKGARPGFTKNIRKKPGLAVIAEYKRASPSLGVIRQDLEIEAVAREYESGGAAAISVLTEESRFDGKLDYIARAAKTTALPLLRKDFIFDPLQVSATATTPAAAILLIARMMEDARKLRELREQAESHGLEAVIEIFDFNDLRIAREAGARIIQVNARDLQRLEIDPQRHLRLIEKAIPQAHELWIAASGISAPNQLYSVQNAGYEAALIGGSLMAKGSPGANLAALLRSLP